MDSEVQRTLHHALQCSSHQSYGLAQEKRATTTRSQLHLWGQRRSRGWSTPARTTAKAARVGLKMRKIFAPPGTGLLRPSVNEVRRFSAMFKNTVSCIPVAPPLLCGIPDADTIRSLYDYTLWLDSLPEYGLLGYNAVLHQILVNTRSDPINHVPGRVVLLTSLYDFEKKLFERQRWQGLSGSVPPLSPQNKKALLTPLLEELSTQFRMNIDTLPNLSRDTTIFPTGPTTVEEDMAALFIGDSNADPFPTPPPPWASFRRPSPQLGGSSRQTPSQPSYLKCRSSVAPSQWGLPL